MNRFRGFSGVFYKEILQLFRDPALLFFSFFPPVVQLIAFGFALDFDVREIRTAVFDQDRSEESRELISQLVATGTFEIVEEADSVAELEHLIVAGDVRVGFSIPPDHSARLQGPGSAQVLVLIDGSDSMFASAALNGANQLGLSRTIRMVEAAPAPAEGQVEMRPRLLFNPDMKSAWFMVPAVIGLALHLATVSMTSFSIVRERERGTLEQLLVTPMTRLGLLVGKLVPAFVVVSVEMVLMFAFMRFLFGVPVLGSPALLFAGGFVYLFTALSIGLVISTMAHNQLQAVQLTIATMLPSVFFSGTIAPLETMPMVFQWISHVIPLTYFARLMRGVTLRGASFSDMLPNILVLLGMGLLLMALAARRFRRTLA